MALTVPTLDVYFINFEQPVQQKSKGSTALKVASYFIAGPLALLATSAALNALGKDGPTLKRLMDEKRFNIITTKEELAKYENGNDNEWVIDSSTLKQRQYYVKHPKKNSKNILIEAKSFYEYIEEEQKDELIEFIMAHCPAKTIKIDKFEASENSANANASIKGFDINGGFEHSKSRGNYYSYSNPNGVPKTEARKNYFWIDKSIMRSIASLTEGASLTQSYESDFTFGLKAEEAKTIGLDMNHHKKYSYTIYIEC